MARFLNLWKDSIGKSPDDLVFTGERKIENVRLRVIHYNGETLEEIELTNIEEARPFVGSDGVTWLNIDGLHDTAVLQEIGRMFKIDNLVMADVLDIHGRPKFHEHEDFLYFATKMLQFDEATEEIISENLSIVFKDNLLISFQERVGDVFSPVRERIRKNRKRIRNSDSDYLAFALLDVVVDNYIHLLSQLGEKIEDLDDELTQHPSTHSLQKINDYKVEVNYLRKTIKPSREMILNFCKSDSEFIDDKTDIHLLELKNNIELANESVDNYRELLSDQLNVFHTTVSYKLNDILKFLTIFSVIFIPITFIAGIYGTNFDFIPELHYRYGYFVMWGVIVITALSMILYFKVKKWF